MTDLDQAGTTTRMGRPPLNVKETKIRLTEEQRARIEKQAGNYGMAKWIRDAINEKLDRDEAPNK